VVEAVDLVEDGRHLHVVIGQRLREAVRRAAGGDLRRVEVVHARPRRAVQELVRGMLVRPRGAAARGLDQLEHVVDPGELVGIDPGGAAVRGVAGQLRRVEGGREGEGKHVEVLLPLDAGPGHAGAARGGERAVVTVVVVDARRARRAPGHHGQEAGKGVRWTGGRGSRVRPARGAELGQGGAGVALDVPRQIPGVEPVDADQQDARDAFVLIVVGAGGPRVGHHDRCRCARHQREEHPSIPEHTAPPFGPAGCRLSLSDAATAPETCHPELTPAEAVPTVRECGRDPPRRHRES